MRPLLIFDGLCGFCSYWVSYWLHLTQDGFEAKAYQKVAAEFPDIPLGRFQKQIVFVDVDGERAFGAEAAFRILAMPGGNPLWLWLYRHVPGYAPAAELAYTLVSRHREAAMRASLWLWGPERVPERHALPCALFLRLLALIYVAAFVSLATQIRGLAGSEGILPVSGYLDAALTQLGTRAYWQVPTLFWLSSSDMALVTACILGALAALTSLIGGRWTPPLLLLCYVLYLSLFYAGQDFMHFQWDTLLLETGFLAVFLPSRSVLVVWLFRWLLFRFVFGSGCVKLLSGDPTWASFTALDYHYETQPLPTPIAWYAHQLPSWFQHACTFAVLAIELGVPFLFFVARRPRMLAAWIILVFELGILLTGNYNFFNLLAMSLCVLLFDDQALRGILPSRYQRWIATSARSRHGFFERVVLGNLVALILFLSVSVMFLQLGRRPLPHPVTAVLEWFAPLAIVNSYGLFANMTTTRPEIVIKGSQDGETWSEYAFRYKPGNTDRRPPWNIPHQPRLDWQMWFAALSTANANPWFTNLLVRLLQNAPIVGGLLESNPFPDAPPRYVRALLYDYRFASPEAHRKGAWWRRELLGTYYPAIRLSKGDETE
ncbi:MAG: lipase maturation factor family protein [Actinomycetota bacterium]